MPSPPTNPSSAYNQQPHLPPPTTPYHRNLNHHHHYPSRPFSIPPTTFPHATPRHHQFPPAAPTPRSTISNPLVLPNFAPTYERRCSCCEPRRPSGRFKYQARKHRTASP
ncbi:hypothetical protein TorRG33x02_074880 [Trema orientale]|uniref:Uncharacterized protein n=1 Tax=Trema orientale TaxID=63057 RepID=A0A2P5FG83_TREOI|nr:hypothetical protein TorRG33x02_074880 [Trema orientale]